MNRALVVLNLQQDFADDGVVGIVGAREAARSVTNAISEPDRPWKKVLAAKDRHVYPGDHFVQWPTHCQEDTPGANFLPEFDSSFVNHTFYKGMHDEGFSAFKSVGDLPDDDFKPRSTDQDNAEFLPLEMYLRIHEISAIDLVGLTYEHEITHTALDALALGLKVRVIRSMSAGVAGVTSEAALDELETKGIQIIQSL